MCSADPNVQHMKEWSSYWGFDASQQGFFDVSAGVGQQVGASYVENMRRADKGVAQTAIADSSDAGDVNEIMDPTKLDPIKAAIYVSQMYESEARALADQEADGEGSSSSSVSDAENASSPSPRKKQIYPKALFDKLTKFYTAHDPAKLSLIAVGDAQVDEAKLNAELLRKYQVGLDSIT